MIVTDLVAQRRKYSTDKTNFCNSNSVRSGIESSSCVLQLMPVQVLAQVAIFTNGGTMQPDDPVCLCFHVTRRKVINFIRVEKPRRPSQLSECFGAGTGCGWCRPYLQRILESESKQTGEPLEELSPADYARLRSKFVLEGGGTPPPGATPIDPT